MPKKKKPAKISSRDLKNRILKFLEHNPGKKYNARQLGRKLNVGNSKDSIQHALNVLREKDVIVEVKDQKYSINVRHLQSSNKSDLYTGRVDMTQRGSAYIICEGLEEDVFVSKRRLNGAMNKDRVEVLITKHRRDRNPEGVVVNIVKRAMDHIIGYIYEVHNKAYAYPLGDHPIGEMEIFLDKLNGAKEGDVVLLKIDSWPRDGRPARAEVEHFLGHYNDHELETLRIILKHGFNLAFPKEVMSEMEGVELDINDEEIEHRRDFRNIPTFTIDPVDAKDFDDALSFRYLDNGLREVGVHIADVTHFLKPGTATDKEAFSRSTSVYLVGKVAPMLPEILSNELCSLKPETDRLTFSAVFVFDNDNRVVERWFGRTIIHSDKRFTYDQAKEALDNPERPYHHELLHLNKLAKQLRKRRFKEGSINFDSDEVNFELNKDGLPIAVHKKVRHEAHLLIEDFMLLANKEVAHYVYHRGKSANIPFVYRIHDEPDPVKLTDFALLARELGFPFDFNTPRNISISFNLLMEKAKEDESLRLLEPLAIRTMAKAEYSTENIGHYGLGFDYYTHFTSPIRRYSDVLAHRILHHVLTHSKDRSIFNELEEKCRHISRQERAAIEAERESIKYKQVEFMQQYIGQIFTGLVNGFIEKGFFVELKESKCEGLVTFDQFDEPYYVAENRFTAMGKHSGHVIRMGDEIEVRVVDTDLERRRIEFQVVHPFGSGTGRHYRSEEE